MRRTFVIVVMLLAVVAAQGQGRGRSWKRGELRVEDFGVIAAAGRETSHLEYAIIYDPSGVQEGNNSYRFCRTSAVMYPTASWMAEGHADEAELTYNQMLFDLVEVYRRQMQREAMLLSKNGQYERLHGMMMEQLEREMQEMAVVTDGGRDSVAVERIRVKNREWLNAHPVGRPDFEPRLYWWNVGIDYGVAIPTGGLANHYSATIGAQGLSFAIGWGRHGLYYRLLSGEVQSYDTLAWAYDDDYSYMIQPFSPRTDITIGYGFTLFDRPSYSITPYIAYGLTYFDWWTGDNYTLGVSGNYHFHHWHRISNAVKGKGKRFTASATANLYVSYNDFMDRDRNGLTLGLQVGLSFLSRSESVSW